MSKPCFPIHPELAVAIRRYLPSSPEPARIRLIDFRPETCGWRLNVTHGYAPSVACLVLQRIPTRPARLNVRVEIGIVVEATGNTFVLLPPLLNIGWYVL